MQKPKSEKRETAAPAAKPREHRPTLVERAEAVVDEMLSAVGIRDPEPEDPVDPARLCGAPGPPYLEMDGVRQTWEVRQTCSRPKGHAGGHGYSPVSLAERRLVRYWSDDLGREVVVDG